MFPESWLKSGRPEVMTSVENVLPYQRSLSQHPQMLPGQERIEFVNVVIMSSSLHFLWVSFLLLSPRRILSRPEAKVPLPTEFKKVRLDTWSINNSDYTTTGP